MLISTLGLGDGGAHDDIMSLPKYIAHPGGSKSLAVRCWMGPVRSLPPGYAFWRRLGRATRFHQTCLTPCLRGALAAMDLIEEVKSSDLARFVRWEKNRLVEMMTDASDNVEAIAIQREAASILEHDFKTNPKLLLTLFGGSGPIGHVSKRLSQLSATAHDKARERVAYETSSPARFNLYLDKMTDLAKLVALWAKEQNTFIAWLDDKYTGEHMIWEANPNTALLTEIIADQAYLWFSRRVITPEFLKYSAVQMFDLFLAERPDMAVLVNLVYTLPKLKTTRQMDIDRTAAEELVDIALGFVPVVGNLIALYSAWDGKDVFGYRLTNLERGVLAASVLLPVAGRLFRHGRAVYTEARLMKMYKAPPKASARQMTKENFANVIQRSAAAKQEEGSKALRAVKKGEDALLNLKVIDGQLSQEAKNLVTLLSKRSAVVPSTVAHEVKALWETVSATFPALRSLDEFALDRVLRKGVNKSHIKGQLLEELMESHIVPMVQQRGAHFAFGVPLPEGKMLQFIPGHVIRSASEKLPLQLTDGIMGYRDKGVFHVLGIFEAKAGKEGPREYLFSRKRTKLTAEETRELKAVALEVWEEERDIAMELGKPFTRRVEDIEKEVPPQFRCTDYSSWDLRLTVTTLLSSSSSATVASSNVTSRGFPPMPTESWPR